MAPQSWARWGHPERLGWPYSLRALTEVAMSGRRRHERFAPAQPWDGALRVLRDVIVQEDPSGSLITIGHAPGVIGEQMTLDVAGAGQVVTLKVRVQESRPVIVDGSVRHRLRLEVLERSRRPEATGEKLVAAV